MAKNKLTAEEVIKALEICSNPKADCEDCPCHNGDCISTTPYVLDLINRLLANIRSKDIIINCLKECVQEAYGDGIKGYREKASIKLVQNARSDYWHWIDDVLYEVEKEMVGEQE